MDKAGMKGTAKVTIEFTYPIDTAHYPDNVTTVAQAVEFDAGEMAGNPVEWIYMGEGIGNGIASTWDNLAISYSVDVKSAQGGFPV